MLFGLFDPAPFTFTTCLHCYPIVGPKWHWAMDIADYDANNERKHSVIKYVSGIKEEFQNCTFKDNLWSPAAHLPWTNNRLSEWCKCSKSYRGRPFQVKLLIYITIDCLVELYWFDTLITTHHKEYCQYCHNVFDFKYATILPLEPRGTFKVCANVRAKTLCER